MVEIYTKHGKNGKWEAWRRMLKINICVYFAFNPQNFGTDSALSLPAKRGIIINRQPVWGSWNAKEPVFIFYKALRSGIIFIIVKICTLHNEQHFGCAFWYPPKRYPAQRRASELRWIFRGKNKVLQILIKWRRSRKPYSILSWSFI